MSKVITDPYMRFTREEALRLHRQMWSDMQKELGDCPDLLGRLCFKRKWVKKHGYDHITNNCFLCEYAIKCDYCPIDWSKLTPNTDSMDFGFCTYKVIGKYGHEEVWGLEPISKILALPERKVAE